ncbi:MAG: hypothetical protein K0Q49_1399 [Haloplasmataceae bacterium]|jgi:histidinol-phosphate phosphatase family protein|nr:hypothetical protein [Haloplasmataceae bacterium]
MIEAVFIDRDGTLGGNGHFIHPKNFELYPFSKTALELLKNNRIKIYAFTNQHRISKGEVSLNDFLVEFESYGFDKSYICPHPMDSDCNCRKPSPGLLIKAAEENNLNLKNCAVIGDVGSDMIAADKVGSIKIIVKTGWGEGSLGLYRDQWQDVTPDYIANNLLDAVNWILSFNEMRAL